MGQHGQLHIHFERKECEDLSRCYGYDVAVHTIRVDTNIRLGYSFAGGTTDGPGAFDFTQGNNQTTQNPLWEIVKSTPRVLSFFVVVTGHLMTIVPSIAVVSPAPSAEQVACHAPKPILLNTGVSSAVTFLSARAY